MKKYFLLSSVLVVALILILNFAQQVSAAAPSFLIVNSTATATTSVNYLTAGTGTTTLIADVYKYLGITDLSDKDLRFNIQFAGSSTDSILCRTVEYSDDGVDWYSMEQTIGTTATTTWQVGGYPATCFPFASTTRAVGAGSNATSTKTVLIPALLRYTKAIFYLPTGSTAGAIWANVIGVKERY
jgi:hypothetical protein